MRFDIYDKLMLWLSVSNILILGFICDNFDAALVWVIMILWKFLKNVEQGSG